MVAWIVVALVVLGLVVLVAVTSSVLRRLSGLRGAVHRLRRRQEQALALQHTAAGLQRSVAAAQERLAAIAADRSGRGAGSNGER